ncbi:MAG: recombinase family protein [Clostridiales Family XIII bacterium]|nr:recombinase family protein [Clostridiales Family XIII bacterium]
MGSKTYGYARVSTKEQNEDRQMLALHEQGIPRDGIFLDKQSGKDFKRPAYQSLMKRLRTGDTLFIKSIDRLGRNYEEIIEQWRIITKKKGAFIVVIDMPLLDTRQRDLDLTGAFIADLVLQILSYVAEKEREFNHQRQAEGIAIALAKGIRFGKPPMERPDAFPDVLAAWLNNEISARRAAKELGVTHPTFLAWAATTTTKALG